MKKFKLRCKCSKCGARQLKDIQDLLNGLGCCVGGGLIKPPCGGALNYYSDDNQDTLLNAANVLCYLGLNLPITNSHLAEIVDAVSDDLQTWLEGVQTPAEMGWVDRHGNP